MLSPPLPHCPSALRYCALDTQVAHQLGEAGCTAHSARFRSELELQRATPCRQYSPAMLTSKAEPPLSPTPLCPAPQRGVSPGKEEGSPSPMATPWAHQKQETRISSVALPTAGLGGSEGDLALAPRYQITHHPQGCPEEVLTTKEGERVLPNHTEECLSVCGWRPALRPHLFSKNTPATSLTSPPP